MYCGCGGECTFALHREARLAIMQIPQAQVLYIAFDVLCPQRGVYFCIATRHNACDRSQFPSANAVHRVCGALAAVRRVFQHRITDRSLRSFKFPKRQDCTSLSPYCGCSAADTSTIQRLEIICSSKGCMLHPPHAVLWLLCRVYFCIT